MMSLMRAPDPWKREDVIYGKFHSKGTKRSLEDQDDHQSRTIVDSSTERRGIKAKAHLSQGCAVRC